MTYFHHFTRIGATFRIMPRVSGVVLAFAKLICRDGRKRGPANILCRKLSSVHANKNMTPH